MGKTMKKITAFQIIDDANSFDKILCVKIVDGKYFAAKLRTSSIRVLIEDIEYVLMDLLKVLEEE